MHGCNRFLISTSMRAIMAASVGAGLFTSAAAVAQTTVSGDSPTAKTAKKKQNSAPPAGAATAQQTSTQAATIVVTGQRRALESATELKRRSDTVSDSVVLDEAGKVKDRESRFEV